MKRHIGSFQLMAAMVLAGMLGWGLGESLQAQDQPPGVARISMIRGDVSIQRGDSGDWVAASINMPVVAGDRISTGQNALVELQLDHANILRLSEQSAANVTGLDGMHIQVQLAQGLAFYSVLHNAEADAEIDTPNVAVHPRAEGTFRIQLYSADETVVMVRKGEADISTSQGSTLVGRGQMINVRGLGTDAQYQIADAPSRDAWDRFNEDRDNSVRNAQSWSHVGVHYTGAADLDAYGRWINVSDYGWVWSPTVVRDWAPYRAGHWIWEPHYGWTWVSNEPWGWAPYHYGRWFSWNDSWVWWPGPVTHWNRPIWAPAYVSFFGFGLGDFGISFGFGFGFGSIGWLPIGPCDPFYPWYGRYGFDFAFADFHRFRDRDFFRNHRGAMAPLAGRFDERFSNFGMAGRDERMLRGVTSLRAEEFGRGAGRRGVAGISSRDFQNSHMVTGGVPAVPTRASLAPSNRAANPATMRNEQGTRFFGRSQAQPAQRASFDEQASRIQNALRGSGNSPAPRQGTQREGMAAGTGTASRPGVGSSTAPPRSLSGNESRPGNSAVAAPDRGGQAGVQGGWNRFGNANGSSSPAGRTAPSQTGPTPAGASRNAQPAGNAPSYRTPAYQTPANREVQSNRPAQNPQSGGSTGGWQQFTPRTATSPAPSPAVRDNRTVAQPQYQGNQSAGRTPASGNNQPGYTSPSYSRPSSSAPSTSRPGYSSPGGNQPSYSAPSTSRPSYGSPSNSARPPLNMSRPIISGQPRSAPSSGSSSRVGSAPSSGSSSRVGSAPSRNSSGSAGSAPRSGSGGRSSAPSRRR
jgi:hypothetical protein